MLAELLNIHESREFFLDRSRKLCVDEIFNAVFISALSMNTQKSDSWLALDKTDWDLFSVARLSKWQFQNEVLIYSE